MLSTLHTWSERLKHALSKLDFLPLLAIRLYLAPIFLSAGLNKLSSFESTVEWFGNADWGLGLPMPMLMAALAVGAEVIGGFALLFGIGTRLVSIPLMVTMLVAAFAVHWENGWFAIAPSSADTSMASLLEKVGFPGSAESVQNTEAVAEKLAMAKSILQEHGNYEWLTEAGSFVVLNNGVEFAVTYFIMLLVLFVYGAGRFVSLDYLIAKALKHRQ